MGSATGIDWGETVMVMEVRFPILLPHPLTKVAFSVENSGLTYCDSRGTLVAQDCRVHRR
jgi:hypothetical protein